MAKTKPKNYKYCIVPKCISTTIKTPNKYFFDVPRQEKLRRKWCRIMRRDDKVPLSSKSVQHCCEDHFDLEIDVENFIRYKLCGGNMKLKSMILPHKFDCQQISKCNNNPRSAFEKRQRKQLVEEAVSCQQQPIEFVSCEEEPDPLHILDVDDYDGFTNKATQNKGIQVSLHIKIVDKICQTKGIRITSENRIFEADEDIDRVEEDEGSACDSTYSFSSTVSNVSGCDEDLEVINHQRSTLIKITHNSQLYLGLSRETYFLIDLLVENVHAPQIHILLVLKKIRLNDSFTRLAIDFSLSKGHISRVFAKTIKCISYYMKELIYFPDPQRVLENLPIAFRKRFSKTQSIIDCFEVRIEKPSNALHQSLTWSEYKSCNTLKYLISITPDGFINFISEGYGGRVSDATLFEDCGILQKIPRGAHIMADRGFKNVAPLVESHGHILVRPPSVQTGIPSKKSDVMETKRIAAVRIHVERAIGRIRDFKMMAPHACVDVKLIPLCDEVAIISCGLVNLQNVLIKQ